MGSSFARSGISNLKALCSAQKYVKSARSQAMSPPTRRWRDHARNEQETESRCSAPSTSLSLAVGLKYAAWPGLRGLYMANSRVLVEKKSPAEEDKVENGARELIDSRPQLEKK
jgi:hypothetical protein